MIFGKKLAAQPHAFATPKEHIPEIENLYARVSHTELQKFGITIRLFHSMIALGGIECYRKLCAALITYSAAFCQERDPVACLLYVIAAESLTAPNQNWNQEKLTKGFVTFLSVWYRACWIR